MTIIAIVVHYSKMYAPDHENLIATYEILPMHTDAHLLCKQLNLALFVSSVRLLARGIRNIWVLFQAPCARKVQESQLQRNGDAMTRKKQRTASICRICMRQTLIRCGRI